MDVNLGLRHTNLVLLLYPGGIHCTASDPHLGLRMMQGYPCFLLLVGWNWFSLQPKTGIPWKRTRGVMKPVTNMVRI